MKDSLNVAFQEHGVLNYTIGLTQALSSAGVNISLITEGKNIEIQGVQVRKFPLSSIQQFMPDRLKKSIISKYLVHPCFLNSLKSMNLSVLHVNYASKCEIFLKAKERYSIPIVYTNHFVMEPEPLTALNPYPSLSEKENLFIPIVCENSAKVTTVSKFARKRLKEEFGIDSEVVYHGVDLDRFNLFIPRTMRKRLNAKDDEKIVLWVARFGHYPYKDPFTFIRAIPLVVEKHADTKFIMVGKGYLKSYAVNLARKLGLKRLQFIDRVEKLNLYYAAADLFVLTSYNDNFGLVVAEAMACGKPIIISNKGAPPEIVENTGLMFEYGNHHDLADKINMLIENEDLGRRLGALAHKRIVENFTWKKAARKYSDIYREVA